MTKCKIHIYIGKLLQARAHAHTHQKTHTPTVLCQSAAHDTSRSATARRDDWYISFAKVADADAVVAVSNKELDGDGATQHTNQKQQQNQKMMTTGT